MRTIGLITIITIIIIIKIINVCAGLIKQKPRLESLTRNPNVNRA